MMATVLARSSCGIELMQDVEFCLKCAATVAILLGAHRARQR